MKKIVMGLAAVAMAASMFAADPAFNPSLAEYSGNASVTWGVNLDEGKTGFTTGTGTANLKFNLFTAGDKATSGDGIWADLQIKNDANDTTGSMGLPTGSLKVDHAKFHIYDVYIGILDGDTTVGGITPLAAVESATVALAATGVNKTDGIVIGYNSDLIDVAVDFRSAQGYTNDYAVAAETTVKPIDGLELKAGVSYGFNASSVAYAGSVAYKIAMGDNYLKPMAGYTGKDGAANDITTGVIYAWGAKKSSALPYFVTGDVNPGVSVVFDYALDGSNAMTIIPSFYLGDDIVENLSCGAYAKIDVASAVKYEVAADVKYTIKADDVSIATKLGTKYAANKLALKAGIDVTGLVNNTTFSIDYASTDLLTPVKGTLDFTAKISL